MVKYLEILKKGLMFGVQPKRWLPFFIVDVVIFSLLVGFVLSNDLLTASLLGVLVNPANLITFQGLAGVFVLLISWFIVRLWVMGAVIHQANKEKEFSKSWMISLRKYPSLLGAMILIMLISLFAGTIPFIANVLSILVGVVFLFNMQAIIVKNRTVISSFKDSYSLFKKHFNPITFNDKRFFVWLAIVIVLGIFSSFVYQTFTPPSLSVGLSLVGTAGFWITFSALAFLLFYSRIFRIWLAISIISGIITILFAFPALGIAISSLSQELLTVGGNAYLPAFLLYFLSNLEVLVLAGMVFIVGSSIATAFTLKVQTDFYNHFRKRFGVM